LTIFCKNGTNGRFLINGTHKSYTFASFGASVGYTFLRYQHKHRIKLSKKNLAFVIIIAIILIDQWSKIYVKTNIEYGTGFDILGLSWAKIYFIENEGMAFGLTFGGVTGKYILSIFRIIMAGFLLYLLNNLIKAGESRGLIVSFSLIVAGAIGNILDSMFYGLIFSPSYMHGGLAQFMPEGGGYAGFLQGKVVDMLYFPMIDTILPDWIPYWGGKRFEFFKPVFNVADSAISVGVASILIFHRNFFMAKEENHTEDLSDESSTATGIQNQDEIKLSPESNDENKIEG
jgi:signal peptidase II